MAIDKGILEHLPDGAVWACIGAVIVYLVRAVAWLFRKDRTSIDQKLIKIFAWLERHDREISDNALLVAREYATKTELGNVAKANREDHKEIKDLVLEVRSMLIKRLAHGGTSE